VGNAIKDYLEWAKKNCPEKIDPFIFWVNFNRIEITYLLNIINYR
jgi:hypothetical protein